MVGSDSGLGRLLVNTNVLLSYKTLNLLLFLEWPRNLNPSKCPNGMFIIVFELITEEIVLACLLIRELYPAFFGSILFTRNAHLDKNEMEKL